MTLSRNRITKATDSAGNMKTIAITPPYFYPKEAEAIVNALRHGYTFVHISKPDSSISELEELIDRIPTQYRSLIFLHQHLQLAVTKGVGGIHLNHHYPRIPEGFTGMTSRTCHTSEDLRNFREHYNYLLFSPIYGSIAKPDYTSVLTRESILSAKRKGLINRDVFALGRITQNELPTIQELGFGGAVVGDSIWKELSIPPVVLTVSCSDCSGSSGIQGDIKAISAMGGYAASVVTALTTQNTEDIMMLEPASPETVRSQLKAIFENMTVSAIKIGMVHDIPTARIIESELNENPGIAIVLDPETISTGGSSLSKEDCLRYMEKHIFPRCTLMTPNLNSASMLSLMPIRSVRQMQAAAKQLYDRYGCNILIRGGRFDSETSYNVLYDGQLHEFRLPLGSIGEIHGEGAAFSSAIATRLAFGDDLYKAVCEALEYLHESIKASAYMYIGHGSPMLWHFHNQNQQTE